MFGEDGGVVGYACAEGEAVIIVTGDDYWDWNRWAY